MNEATTSEATHRTAARFLDRGDAFEGDNGVWYLIDGITETCDRIVVRTTSGPSFVYDPAELVTVR